MYYQRAVQCYDQKYPTESLALELGFHLEEKPSQPPTNFLAPKPDDLYKLVKDTEACHQHHQSQVIFFSFSLLLTPLSLS